MSLNNLPFTAIFGFGNRKESYSAKFGEQERFGRKVILFVARNSRADKAE
jgi:hypothetical protein